MLAKKTVILTIPLFPYLAKGRRTPQKTKRIRPQDALNLKTMLKEMKKGEVAAFNIAGKPWSLVSVFSSYSPDVHVMLLETSPDRYLPGPERIAEREGERLMKLWAAMLDLIAKRKNISSIHVGYNWSPRSWGIEEEKTGFQSLPTKFHPHLWGWPALDKNVFAEKVLTSSLLPQERRLLGQNDYARPFGELIKKRIEKNKIFPLHNWRIDSRGIYIRFNKSVIDIVGEPGFFAKVLKPLAVLMEKITRELTETLTTIRCKEIDGILAKNRSKNLKKLRADPVMRDEKYIRKVFKQRGYPKGLLEAILPAVLKRCRREGDSFNWWRKCFAYALVFNGPAKGSRCELRIMPGVYIGPGGVVEAEGFIIRRPEDRQFSDIEIRRKSEDLRTLAKELKKHFPL